MMELRPYQEKAIEATLSDYSKDPNGSGVLYLATGTGKTVIAAELAKRIGGRTLFLVHRDELARQTVEKFGAVWPEVELGVVKAERNETDKQVTVASIQSIISDKRLEQIRKNDYKTVIIDECHHISSVSWTKVVKALSGYKVGLTATPERTDGARTDHIFNKILYQYTIVDGIRDEYLCDLYGKIFRLDDLDLDQIGTAMGDFKVGKLSERLCSVQMVKAVVDAWESEGGSLKTAFFCVDVLHAREITMELSRRGYKADYVSGDLEVNDRRSRMSRFSSGETQCLASCMVLTEGWDEPSVECIALARPTKSQSLYIQMVGRGTRLHPGKTACKVLDFAGVTKRHEILQLGILAGYDPLGAKASSKSKGELRELIDIPSLRNAILNGTHLEIIPKSKIIPINKVEPDWIRIDGYEVLMLGYGYNNGFLRIEGNTTYHYHKEGWRLNRVALHEGTVSIMKKWTIDFIKRNYPFLVKEHTTNNASHAPSTSQNVFLAQLGLADKDPASKQEANRLVCSILWPRFLSQFEYAMDSEDGKHYIYKMEAKHRACLVTADITFGEIKYLRKGEVKELFYKWTKTNIVQLPKFKQLKMSL
jgi:superfamily II DNA or RNA helicase